MKSPSMMFIKKKTYHSKIHKKVCIYYIKYNIGLYNDIFGVYYDLWNSIQAASNKILLYVFLGGVARELQHIIA